MTNKQVAERFASEDNHDGHSLNVFINSDVIFSYGYHFPIAKKTDLHDDNGERIVFFTTRNYSVTTSSHKSDVRWALSSNGFRIIEVENVEAVNRQAIDDLTVQQNEAQGKAERARREWSKSQWHAKFAQCKADISLLSRLIDNQVLQANTVI